MQPTNLAAKKARRRRKIVDSLAFGWSYLGYISCYLDSYFMPTTIPTMKPLSPNHFISANFVHPHVGPLLLTQLQPNHVLQFMDAVNLTHTPTLLSLAQTAPFYIIQVKFVTSHLTVTTTSQFPTCPSSLPLLRGNHQLPVRSIYWCSTSVYGWETQWIQP